MGAFLGRVARLALRKGLRDGSRPWLWLGVTAGGLALLNRLLHRPPETIFATAIEPGEVLEIRGLAPSE